MVSRKLNKASISTQEIVDFFFKRMSFKTAHAYRYDLSLLCRFLAKDNIEELVAKYLEEGHRAANLDVMNYQLFLIKNGLSNATVNRRISAVRSLFSFMQSMGEETTALSLHM